jgi:sec-independent protein translocase protein TatA
MLGNISGWHLLIIVAIVILLFGATKLPALAKGIGQSMRIFKNEIKPQSEAIDDEVRATAADAAPASGSPAAPHRADAA